MYPISPKYFVHRELASLYRYFYQQPHVRCCVGGFYVNETNMVMDQPIGVGNNILHYVYVILGWFIRRRNT